MRRFLVWLTLAAVLVAAGALVFLLWDVDLRWRPHTLGKDQAAIGQALEQAGWVSPHLTGPKVYVILPGAGADCGPCRALLDQAVPKLEAAGVDTRMIAIAPADENGQARSTPQSRALVAELWTNRSWKLFQQWSAPVPDKPTPPGQPPYVAPTAPPADGDAARTAVVSASRQLVQTLTPLLKENGVSLAYPTLVWWTKKGEMRACACTDPHMFAPMEKELGA